MTVRRKTTKASDKTAPAVQVGQAQLIVKRQGARSEGDDNDACLARTGAPSSRNRSGNVNVAGSKVSDPISATTNTNISGHVAQTKLGNLHSRDLDNAKRPIIQRHGFKVGEIVVYAKLGVARIGGIKEKQVADQALEMFIIHSADKKLTVMLPTQRAEALGLRKLSSPETVARAFAALSKRVRVRRMIWARRALEYTARIKAGELVALAEAARELYRSADMAEGSYSERILYDECISRMTAEIAAMQKIPDHEARELIEAELQKGQVRR